MARFHMNSSKFQIILVGLICFCAPGMFNALNALGGGGQVDNTTASKANTALYITFSVFGLLGGGIVNILGIRITMFLGGLTYALYSGSYIYYNNTENSGFTIAAGAILGIGAGILWAGQGMVMTSYPLEHEKGNYIFIFWSIFNLGGVIGSLIPLLVKYEGNLPNTGYIAFLVIECIGSCLAFVLSPPSKVIRSDGSEVIISKQENVVGEFVQILKLFINPSMLILFFMAFSSNFFYSFQFNYYNGDYFEGNSKGFNNIFYWSSQMLGAYVTSLILDSKLPRKKRAYIGTTFVFVLFNAVWIWTIIQKNKFKYILDDPTQQLNYKTSGAKYVGPLILYSLMGLVDAAWQSLAYWLIGSFTNDSIVLSRYVGYYKGVQSAGAAVSWAINVGGMKRNDQLIFNMVILNVAVPFMYLLCHRTTETSVEDTKEDYEE
ncbi:hypothetical protein BB559_000488 [Furculomyces boomerangus]|uniref:Major facilitator superfamily (MFS) profile domain-containing protein n=2 Tax=Harpellales TaxID=61421 RepID=A0A2T9YDL2_9FUNG|nr:hypothetical protein BB559_004677 [Furculomyces boomerangus]PVU99693.1 hypothetical protein BB559_000488 [Furculomyces boomerangus]PVZ97487.1 hypothetical protein BB558_006558 [Smittium angustum]PVZ99623.1 hypothetical protein BB558_004344 [Smittium angustum]